MFPVRQKVNDFREEVIADNQGIYFYDYDPRDYKKARKRMQNKDSAIRTRMKKKAYYDSIEA